MSLLLYITTSFIVAMLFGGMVRVGMGENNG